MNSAIIRDAAKADLPAIAELLQASGLSGDGVEEFLPNFAVADDGGTIVGVGGLEPHGPDALFRSLAVDSSCRSMGVGDRLLRHLTARARRMGAVRLLLLTTTAESYFARHGFTIIDRRAVVGPVAASVQFRGACPSTAVCMERTITGIGPA